MNDLIVLKRIKVENANGIAGLTWGFPAVSHFLGYTHALDRKLRTGTNLPPALDGVAIVCHQHQLLTDNNGYGEHGLALTRNPVTKKGETAPFNEEGRMHLELSLLIECKLDPDDYADELGLDAEDQENDELFRRAVEHIAVGQRLAGGLITDIEAVRFLQLPDEPKERQKVLRGVMYGCLPGFALVDRSTLLEVHHDSLKQHYPETTKIQAWMDFGGLRYRAEHSDADSDCEWTRVTLPEQGWFVPLMVGYQAIADLQAPGSVECVRDPSVPFCVVEPIHGVGQWLSPHRCDDVESLLWRYPENLEQGYRFTNRYSKTTA